MSQIDRESISALLDNEADELELRRFLKASEQDPTLLETWERFSLVQSVLHESAQPVSSGLSQRIAAELENEAPLSAAPSAATTSYWKEGMSKIAIAASVAAVFFVAVQVNLDSGPGSTAVPTLADQSAESTELPSTGSPAPIALLADSNGVEASVVDGGIVRQYIESLKIDEEEPVLMEHIQDSPLYRLVNELQAKP